MLHHPKAQEAVKLFVKNESWGLQELQWQFFWKRVMKQPYRKIKGSVER